MKTDAIQDWLEALESQLREAGDPARAAGEKAYLKSDLEFIGTGVPYLRGVAKRFGKTFPEMSRDDLIAVVEALWRPPVHELRSLAIAILEVYKDRLNAEDVPLLESLLRQCHTWAHVDWLAVKVCGPLLERIPDGDAIRERWGQDDWMWLRRSALLSHLEALRAGGGDFAGFSRLAEGMLDESEFFIRKAIGWILRDLSRRRPALAKKFLESHLDRVSGLTLREGSKYLPAREREALLAGYQARKASKRAKA